MYYIYESGAWYVTSSGVVDNYRGNVRDSYGHLFDRLFQNSIIFVVKIAVHGLPRQLLCVFCLPVRSH